MIFTGHPDWLVTIDGRIYLYSLDDWQEYEDIARGLVPLQWILTKYQPDAFVLHPHFHRNLIRQLDENARHERIYGDGLCVVYVPSRSF